MSEKGYEKNQRSQTGARGKKRAGREGGRSRRPGRGKRIMIYILAFVLSFAGSALFKLTYDPFHGKYKVKWSKEIGTVAEDLSYGEKPANRFDLCLPADGTKEHYGLVIYLHPGGFTSGDKSGDREMLQWLCSKGYVSASINYTLFSEENPDANIYTQSLEIREAVPAVIRAAKERGYDIDQMAMAGGSAGGCLALLYAYRDAAQAPVPVRMVFEAVGPSSFYPQDWGCLGFDQDTAEAREAAAGLFSTMSGEKITAEMFGTKAYDEKIRRISALLWVDEDTVPTVLAYGKYDKVQSFPASERLDRALTKAGVPHEYIVCAHSGHGLQNDNAQYGRYMEKVEEYLQKYLPVR